MAQRETTRSPQRPPHTPQARHRRFTGETTRPDDGGDDDMRRLAEQTGIRSDVLLRRMLALGFDAESVGLLFLVPVVGMAAADGAVSYDERALVKDLARAGGIRPDSAAWALLDGWLLEPPPSETFERMMTLLRDVLAAVPRHEADDLRKRLRRAQRRVAQASGGFLGFWRTSPAERRFLAKSSAIV